MKIDAIIKLLISVFSEDNIIRKQRRLNRLQIDNIIIVNRFFEADIIREQRR